MRTFFDVVLNNALPSLTLYLTMRYLLYAVLNNA